MESKEFQFKGLALNGIMMLILSIVLCLGSIGLMAYGVQSDFGSPVAVGAVLLIVSIIMFCGFIQVEPNEARVIMFFGEYCGTFKRVGYYWINPFMSAKKLSLRARNLDAQPIKVNDKTGNPVMIGLVVVWKLKDTYKAMFDIDAQTMAVKTDGSQSVQNVMKAFENFVSIQSDAALRQVAGQFAYDNADSKDSQPTLRDSSDEINEVLEKNLNERLTMAGIEIVEARINYLAYAPEIAAVMLRRQQADAIISAREKIVEGAVSMVKMALDKLSEEEVVELDDEKKAAMVSNLLVVLCGDENAQPVVNTGTLNH